MTRIQRLAAGGALLSVAAAALPAAPAYGQDFEVSKAPAAAEAAPSAIQQIVASGVVLGEPVSAKGDVERFYEKRDGSPAWIQRGRLSGEARELIEALQNADAHGLDPNAYHLAALSGAVDARGRVSAGQEDAVDALLTDAFMRFANHLLNGRINPESLASDVEATMEARDLVSTLSFALDRGAVADALDGLAPQHPQYAMLQDAYARYREAALNAPWPKIGEGKTLKPGMTDARVQEIRARLDAEAEFDGAAAGDEPAFIPALFSRHTGGNAPADTASLGTSVDAGDAMEETAAGETMTAPAADPNLYDEALAARIEAFQQRHGLAVDGVVGPDTVAMLNQGLAERTQAIEMNLERWRWLPNDLGDRYLLVNTPQYRLHGYENGRETMDMDVIVGRTDRPSPQFSDQMEYIVVNPNWNVPYSIATIDKLPKLRSDPSYFDRNGYSIYNSSGQRVSPTSVNWNAYSRGNFPFRIVQKPGSNNALGTIKFIFPNQHNVYLHDTDSPQLFAENERSMSSGCIRVSDPSGLARWVTGGDPELDFGELQTAWDSGRTETLYLGEKLPVHVAYFTTWADDDGSLDFYGDIYDRDARLQAAMFGAS